MGAEPRMGQTLASFLHASDLFGAAAYPEQELSRGEALASLTGPSEDHAPGQSTFEMLNETLSLEQLRCNQTMIPEWFPELPPASADRYVFFYASFLSFSAANTIVVGGTAPGDRLLPAH